MSRLMDVITGRRAAEQRALRDQREREADLAIEQVRADNEALRKRRAALENLVDEFKERRRGNNA